MLTNYVFAGDKVELQSVDDLFGSDSAGGKTYTTKVFDVLDEDKLEIVMPMEKTKLQLLPIDSEYAIYFYTNQGLFQCFARIYDRYKSNNVYVLAFELTSNLRKHQRREYYRFSCVMDMRVRELKTEELQALSEKRTLIVPGLPLRRSMICDISGGGMRFISDVEYDEGTYLYCTYELEKDGEIKDFDIIAKVLTVKEVPNRPGEYEHRIQYINLDHDDQEEIIKYIFEEERRLRRNRKI
ncbi:MAG: flagellar brake protein [Lachnospiraceae bacterium]|nr:flagellar brake protein [Lachnospiraceae bacterium]